MSESEMHWLSGRHGELGSGGLAARLKAAIAAVETEGVAVPSHSRVRSALRFLSRLTVEEMTERAHEPDFQRAVREHHRTAWEFFQITYAATLMRRADTPFRIEKFKQMIRGADFDDGSNPLPRNIQFELYVAAQLRLGGASVYSGEPDLLFDFRQERVGVAAKRIRSTNENTVANRLREAADQIAESKRRGFIAVNVDHRFETAELPPTREELHQAIHETFDAAMNFRKASRVPGVLGVMAYGYTAQLIPPREGEELYGLQVTAPFRFERWVDDGTREAEEFSEFARRWHSGLDAHLEYLVSDGFPRGELPER